MMLLTSLWKLGGNPDDLPIQSFWLPDSWERGELRLVGGAAIGGPVVCVAGDEVSPEANAVEATEVGGSVGKVTGS